MGPEEPKSAADADAITALHPAAGCIGRGCFSKLCCFGSFLQTENLNFCCSVVRV